MSLILHPKTGKPVTFVNGKVRNVKRNGTGGLRGYVPTSPFGPRYSGAYPGLDRGVFGLQISRDFKETGLLDQPYLAGMGRLLYQSQPTIHAIVNQFVQHTVGEGKFPHSQSEKGAGEYEAYFNEWSKKCTTDGLSWTRVQEICFREMLVVGDVGILKTKENGRSLLQLIEGHNLGQTSTKDVPNENIVLGGVEIRKKGGRVVRYHVGNGYDAEPMIFKPSEFMLMFMPERINQTRGISRIALAVVDALDESSILDFMKMTLRWHARMGGIIKREDDADDRDDDWTDPSGSASSGYGLQITRLPLPADTRYEQTQGVEIPILKPGEDYADFQSTRPNSNFIPFIEHVNKRMCLSVGVSYDFLLNSNLTDGPAMRKDMEQADYAFCNLCNLLNEQLNQPVWEYVISRGMLRGDIPIHPDWNVVDWDVPRRLSVDIGRESKSMINEVNSGLRTRDEIHKAEGSSFDEKLAQNEYEELQMQMAAKRIAQEAGVDDVQSIRNALASTGQVNEKPPPKEDFGPEKKKVDKKPDSSKSN